MGVGSRLKEILASRSLPLVYYEMTFIVFAIMMAMSLPASFLPIMAQGLDPSGVLVGMVVSAWFLTRIFLNIPAGMLSDRIGRWRLLIFGIGFSALGPILCAFAPNIYILILGRALWGVGTAFYFMNNYALLMDILPVNVRGRALGFFQGLEFVGSFIGAPAGAFLAISLSYSQVFYFSLALTIISLIVALRSKGSNVEETKSAERSSPSINEIKKGLKNWGILIVSFCSFLRYFINMGVFQTIFQLYLHEGLAYSIETIGIILSVRILGQVLSIIVAGVLSDRMGRKPVLIAGYIISASAFFLFTVIHDLGTIMLTTFVQGIGEGFGFTTLIALLTDLSPPNIRGGVVGIYRTFNDVGGFVGPVAFMIIYGGSRATNVFHLCTVLNILSIALIFALRTRQSETSKSL